MKKKIIAGALALASVSTNAQVEDFGIFDHVGVGVELGTTGIGFEVSAPITNHFQVRAGYNFMPITKVKDISVDISSNKAQWDEIKTHANTLSQYVNDTRLNEFSNKYMQSELPNDVLIDGKLNMNNFKFLVDIFPFKKSSFRITAGFYAGKSQFIEAYTTNCQNQLGAITYFNQNLAGQNYSVTYQGQKYSYTFPEKIGAKLGDYLIEPNGEQARAYLKVNGFKPYLGIGFGRAIPKKRVGVAFDLGVQFWGTPKIYVDQPNGQLEIKEDSNIDGGGDIIKTISKVSVYPCLSFRINGRIF